MSKKITLSVPDDIYNTLEVSRGSIPRSTYIQGLILSNATEVRFDDDNLEVVEDIEEVEEPIEVKEDLPEAKEGFHSFSKAEQFARVKKRK